MVDLLPPTPARRPSGCGRRVGPRARGVGQLAGECQRPFEDGFGVVVERLIIRFLYGRIIDTLLATWGLSLFFLTVLVRILLFPIFVKQIKTQRAMSVLAPKVKELQVKYKKDRERMNTEVMALYKEHNANPLMGCLPLLLQMPVFYALFHVLRYIAEHGGSARANQMAWEVEALVDCGLEPWEALAAATWKGGQVLGEPGAGVIEEGGPPDFFLVHGDPLSDPSALWRVWKVA